MRIKRKRHSPPRPVIIRITGPARDARAVMMVIRSALRNGPVVPTNGWCLVHTKVIVRQRNGARVW